MLPGLGKKRIKIGKLDEIPEGGALEKRILARRVAVFKQDGRLYGMESGCKHMGASLATGKFEDGVVTCRWHGWQYDIATGECLGRSGMGLKRYDVEVDGDDVYILM